jgi:hypothetical protein
MRYLLQQIVERKIQHDKLVAELSKHIVNDGTDSKHIAIFCQDYITILNYFTLVFSELLEDLSYQ